MKCDYESYMWSQPMTDGEEMRSFFNDFEVGDRVAIIGEFFLLHGKGTIVEILDNCNKAVVNFPDGKTYVDINKLRFV